MGNQFENQVMEMLKQLTERMEQGFSWVNERLDGIDERLNQVELRLGGIDEKLDVIGGNLKKPQNN